MGSDRSVTATFTLPPKQLHVTTTGAGTGTVTTSPAGISCGSTCSKDFAYGTSVTLRATPATGSVFVGWSGAGCSGTGSCTVHMDADRSVNAAFALRKYRVPKVKGLRLRAARKAITHAHLAVGRIRHSYSHHVRRGRVLSQRPRAGSLRPLGTKVKLVVSKGKRR